MDQRIRQKIESCTTLPSLPAAAIKVLQLTQNNDTELDRLVDVIENDPALSVKILRAINSPFYGLGQRVNSVQQAVVLLGLHSVKTLVLGFTLVNTFRNQKPGGFNHLAYWRRSMYAAAAARVIAGRVLPGHEENCFVAALIMDIGTLVLDQLLGEQYGEVYEKASAHADLPIVETHALGTTHAEVAGVLAKHWSLPDMLAIPMASHHGPKDVEDYLLRKVTQVVWLAGRCADIFTADKGAAESIAGVRATCRELYQLKDLDSDAMLCTIGQKTKELAHLFEVRMTGSADYEQILAKASERLLELTLAERSGDDANKRRSARMRRDGKITIHPCDQGILGAPIQVRLRDVSASGIGLTHSARLEKGTQFVIQLNDKNGSKTLLYKVVRCDTFGDLSSIGGELVSVLRPESAEAKAAASAVAASAAVNASAQPAQAA